MRLEDHPDPKEKTGYIPYVPRMRDRAWQALYGKYIGQIDEQFAFLAFRTPPLVSPYTMDAKVVTSEMASHMMVWAAFGKPNEREWVPRKGDFSKDDGLYPSGYYLFTAESSPSTKAILRRNETVRLAAAVAPANPSKAAAEQANYEDRVWKGWLLPASDADVWFVAGASSYRRVLTSKNPAQAVDAKRATWRRLDLDPNNPANQFVRKQTEGVLFLDALRQQKGDDAFFKLMNDYFSANTTKAVTAKSFLEFVGAKDDTVDPPDGPAYLASDMWDREKTAVIVYGTLRDAGANRYAAEQLQVMFLDDYESRIQIYKDFEVTNDLLKTHDVVFVGRPETNSALVAWADELGLNYTGAAFQVNGKTYASERDGLIFAAKNPLAPLHMVLVVAGNDALSTVKAQKTELPDTQFVIVQGTGEPAKGFAQNAPSGVQTAKKASP